MTPDTRSRWGDFAPGPRSRVIRAGAYAGFAAALVAACSQPPVAAAGAHGAGSDGLHKLSAAVQARSRAGHSGTIWVLIRTAAPLSDADRTALEGLGLSVQRVAGDVTVGTVDTEQVGRLAALGFVRYVDLARPVSPDVEGLP